MYLKIQTTDELLCFIKEIKKTPITWVAIDTEFQRETTFFPILSLIQIATESKIWLIDALSCADLTPLKILLENKKIKKIFHAGDQDWEILKQSTGAITCATGCKWPTPYYALELSKWREGWAKKLDIPKRHVIGDNLLEQALRTKNLSHINENNCKPDAFEDLKIVWEKLGREHNQYKKDRSVLNQMVKVHHQDFTLAQRKLLKKWQSRSKIIAKQLDIPPHCVLNKQQLQLIVSGKKSSISGWRKEFLKEKNY